MTSLILIHSVSAFGHGTTYLVDNVYISVGNKVFRQCIGIPMGTNCAPLLANLYAFYFEYKIIYERTGSDNMSKVRTFSNIFRHIDDLLTLNNPSFENAISDHLS